MQITILALDEVDSTNAYAKRNFAALPDGTLVTARRQSAGRGRFDRNWFSPPDVNFYGTLILKNLAVPFSATPLMSLAALATLRELAPPLAAWLKWPNDLYVGFAKLAGLLSEALVQSDGGFGVLVGLGVNLGLAPDSSATAGKPATSVLAATGIEINPAFFAEKLAKKLNTDYINRMYTGALHAEWREANRVIGGEIELLTGGKTVRGVVADIAADGAIILRLPDGTECKFYSGDASVVPGSIKGISAIT